MDDRCKTCRHGDLRWDEEPCESCCVANDGYEPRGDRMDRYDPYTDKFLRDTQYGVLGTDVPDTNVGDMISRQAAIDVIKKHYRAYDNDLLELITFRIKQLPSAEPEIIYCKDCKYRNPFIKDTATMWLPCMAIDTDDKWFCGYGE